MVGEGTVGDIYGFGGNSFGKYGVFNYILMSSNKSNFFVLCKMTKNYLSKILCPLSLLNPLNFFIYYSIINMIS